MLSGQRSELGQVVAARHAAVDGGGRDRTLLNLALQHPNTLLHDGHAWRHNAAQHIVSATRRALAEADRTRCGFLVHASYAFLDNAAAGGRVGGTLRPIVEAAQQAERLVLESGRRAVVVRVGYLYGPEWRDLRAYRRAFALGRPYWAGPRDNLQHHVHAHDAARALLHAAARRPEGPVLYATDGRLASFADFMDHFARRVGRSRPLHIPGIAGPLMRPVVRSAHQQMVDLAATRTAMPQVPGFTPRYPDFRAGLDQVLEAWQAG